MMTIVYDQEPKPTPLEVVEITLNNPQSTLIMPVIISGPIFFNFSSGRCRTC